MDQPWKVNRLMPAHLSLPAREGEKAKEPAPSQVCPTTSRTHIPTESLQPLLRLGNQDAAFAAKTKTTSPRAAGVTARRPHILALG